MISRHIQDVFQEFTRFARKAYPPFVTAMAPAPLSPGHIPVFCFHSIEADPFEERLAFLRDNGYRTLTTAEWYDGITGRRPVPASSVMLTFDDGEQSLGSAGMPLLRKYGFNAVAFVVPGRLLAETPPAAGNGKRWLSWTELDELSRSGVVDIQSHTLNHTRIFVGAEVQDFLHPDLFTDQLGLGNPVVREAGREIRLAAPGAPIYPMDSRMSASPRYFDNAAVREACVSYVETHGGNNFFRNPGWRNLLKTRFDDASASAAGKGHFESPEEQKQAVLEHLSRARTLLEERLHKPVTHLAYPWGVGSELSVELSRQAGYLSNFWGALPGVPLCTIGQDPFRIPRLKDDYIFRLPGKGRKSLLSVFLLKGNRRLRQKDIY